MKQFRKLSTVNLKHLLDLLERYLKEKYPDWDLWMFRL